VNRTRVVRAFLVAPLTAPLVYCLIGTAGVALDPVRRGSLGHNFFAGVAMVFAFGAPVAYVVALAAGLNVLWLTRRTALTLGRTVPFGVVAGLATSLLLGPRLHGDLISIPLPPWEGVVVGALTSAVWWWLARPARGTS
jgi:hypothetical protein